MRAVCLPSTVDFQLTELCDRFPDQVQIAEPLLRDFGGRSRFAGPIVTLKVFENPALLRETLSEPGAGRVLVVDGGGSQHCALLNADLAQLALRNGWAGLVINGGVRHSTALATVPIGIRALAVHPRQCDKHGAGERDAPLRFAGVHFVPGHFLYADEDGLGVAEHPLRPPADPS